ncbi:hypothetical protein DY000_02031889 [Brassica cretica]|uniref:Uncharacterized protein n=1 Tax=Brassica cretica TaxID=69181 RepID=A0ABQ7DNY1_BRACR|nr:hypothetical protein DY000_02031889 [Brassica cretica]
MMNLLSYSHADLSSPSEAALLLSMTMMVTNPPSCLRPPPDPPPSSCLNALLNAHSFPSSLRNHQTCQTLLSSTSPLYTFSPAPLHDLLL